MKRIPYSLRLLLLMALLAGMSSTFSGCSIFGLDWQKDYDRKPDTLDAHLYQNAWEYLKARSIGKQPDTVFKRMYDAIMYSGMDTAEYMQTDRTFIFLHNDAIYRKGAVDCYFGAVKDTLGKTGGTTWTTYRKQDVKNYLLYLIAKGQYSHYNLPIRNVFMNTLAPQGVYTLYNNPNSLMAIQVINASNGNTQDDPLQLNNQIYVRTADLVATNGIVHVIGTYVSPVVPPQ